MKEWLKRLFHRHQWDVYEKASITGSDGHQKGVMYIMRCKECGDIKKVMCCI